MSAHDCIVIGGGPAGLSAAIHLAWHNRNILLIDRKTGPLFFTLEKLSNVPGMPAVRGIEIQRNLLNQARELGAEIAKGNVISVEGKIGDFSLRGERGEAWEAKTLLLATGVARYHPLVSGDFTPCFAYAVKGNLFYCPDCEAPEIKGKDTIVIGAGPADWAASMAMSLSRYTPKLRVLLTRDKEISEPRKDGLKQKNIPIVEGAIKFLIGKRGVLSGLLLEDGSELEADAFFVSNQVLGRTHLAQQLGVEMAATGNHAQPKSQRGDTNVPGVWIAGDLRPMTQQVSVAMGTGNIAAVMVDQFLRKNDIRG